MARSIPPKPEVPEPPSPYEFSDDHKDSLQALGASMSFVGVCTMMLAFLFAIFALGAIYEGFWPSAVGMGAYATLAAFMAAWMVSGGRSLNGLVRTRGRGVEQLMEAVVQLRRMFGLARIVIIVSAVGAMAIVALATWCMLEKGGKCFGLG